MYQTVAAVLVEHLVEVQSLPILVKTTERFNELRRHIDTKIIEQRNAVLGKTGAKAQIRHELIALMSDLANSLKAYAAAHNNPELMEHAAISLKIKSIRDTRLVSLAENLTEQMDKALPNMGDYAVKPEKVAALRQKAADFMEAIGARVSSVAQRHAVGNSLDDLFDQTDALLKLELDPLVNSMQHDYLEFVAAYRAARKVWDLGMGRRAADPAAPASDVPVN